MLFKKKKKFCVSQCEIEILEIYETKRDAYFMETEQDFLDLSGIPKLNCRSLDHKNPITGINRFNLNNPNKCGYFRR